MLALILQEFGFTFDFQHTLSAVIDAVCVAAIMGFGAFLVAQFRLLLELKGAYIDIIEEKIERKVTSAKRHDYITIDQYKSTKKLYDRYCRLTKNNVDSFVVGLMDDFEKLDKK